MSLTDKQRKNYRILGDRHQAKIERLRKARLASNVTSVSSNSKWEIIFNTLHSQFQSDTKCMIKLLKQEEPWEYKNLLSAVFEESYLDGMSGPLTYAEIEWLDLACEGIPNFEFQVDMEVGENFVVIYGYRRSPL